MMLAASIYFPISPDDHFATALTHPSQKAQDYQLAEFMEPATNRNTRTRCYHFTIKDYND